MFVHLAIHKPRPGKEKLLIESMHRFGHAMLGSAGLQQVHTLMDQKNGALVGLAVWDTKDDWEAAQSKMAEAIMNDPFHEWEDNPPEVFQLESV